MLLPEHLSALEALINKIYDVGLHASDGVVDPVPGVIGHPAISLGSKEAATYEQLTAEIVSCVRMQCALQMRARNRVVVPPQYQLPVELWAAVFAKLARHDLISASHVSHDWREAATASSQLWSSPFFLTAAHAINCDCYACSFSGPCRDCGSINRTQHNPVDQVQTFLARSGSHPLDLKLSLFSRAAPSAFADLTAAIQPHICRINSLRLYTADQDSANDFLPSIGSFLALESLTMELDFNGELTWECARPVHLSKLKSINILGPLYCADDQPFELRCPAVTTLHAAFNSPSHLIPLLRMCPAVQDLELMIGPRSLVVSSPEELDVIHTLLKEAHPKQVRLEEAYDGDFGILLQLFNATEIPTLEISLRSGERILNDELTRLLCNEVKRPVLLECRLLEGGTAIDYTRFRLATSDTMYERACTFELRNRDDVNAVICNLWRRPSCSSFGSVRNLRASSFLWSAIFHSDEQLEIPPVTHAHIDIDGGDILAMWLQGRTAAIQGGTERSLPQLEVLRFSSVTPHQPLQLDAALVDAMREAFCLKSKLQLLELEGFALEGDLTTFHAISHEVVVV